MRTIRYNTVLPVLGILLALTLPAFGQGNLDMSLTGNSFQLTTAGGSFDVFLESIGYSNDPGQSVTLDNYTVTQIGGPDPGLLGAYLTDDPTNGFFSPNYFLQTIASGSSLGAGLLDSFTLAAGATPGVYTLDLSAYGSPSEGGSDISTLTNEGLMSLTISAPESEVPEGATPTTLLATVLLGLTALRTARRRKDSARPMV